MSRLLCTLVLLACTPAWAVDSDLELAQVSHRKWNGVEMAPSLVTGFAQDADDRLWLASAAGLHKFDGVLFSVGSHSPDSLRASNLTTVFTAADGALWIGFRRGGAATYRLGEPFHFGEREGLGPGTVRGIVQDSKGTIWLASDDGLFRFEAQRWRSVAAEIGLPAGPVLNVRVARDGSLWIAVPDGVFSLSSGNAQVALLLAQRFADDALIYMAQAADGALWLSDSSRGVLQIAPGSSAAPRWWLRGQGVGPLLFDRDGSLWIGGDQLRRITRARLAAGPDDSANPIDELDFDSGLSGTEVLSLFEDRNGIVWAGTDRGVDRFRHADVAWVVQPQVGQDKVIVADAERTWVADRDGGLYAFEGSKFVTRLAGPRFTAGFRDRGGGIWFAGPEGIARLSDDRRLALTPLPSRALGREVQAMTGDATGALWISIDRVGLFRLRGHQWTEAAYPSLPREAPLVATTDDSGNVWLGYRDNRLGRISDDSVQLFTAADGIDVNNVMALHARASHLWVGGDVGLGLFDGARFIPMAAASCQPFVAVTGVVETAAGDLWVFRRGALSRIKHIANVAQGLQPYQRVACTSFGSHELPKPTPQQVRPVASLTEAADGRLWLAANEGLAWIDPRRISREVQPPPRASIDAIVIDGRNYLSFNGTTVLPVHTRELMITFGAANIGSPEGLRYRYRLAGQDSEWKVVMESPAAYTNLSPGSYRFQITASNWTNLPGPPASIEFIIPPAFYQTIWFRALGVLAGALLLAWFVRMQVRRANVQLRARLEDRMRERERIARELHDTLLQGIQALVLRFQGAAARIPRNEPARDLMERALELADDVISEGRDRVNDLRDSNAAPEHLVQEIARIGKEILEESSVRFAVTVQGRPRALHPVVREEAFLISREALANARRHAQARVVEVTLFYERAALRISIRDDGCGIDDSVLQAGGREKHWGLKGMRERADRIRGRIDIWSRSGAGTEIELRVPASMAYRNGRSRWRWFADLIGRGNTL